MLIKSNSEKPLSFLTAPVVFSGGTWAVVSYVVHESEVRLWINKTRIPSREESDDPVSVVLGKGSEGDEQSSYQVPEARESCKQWIEWRADHLRNLPVTTKGVPKSPEEQITELREAVVRIRDLVSVIETGQHSWIGNLSVELRSLLYWSESEFEVATRKKPKPNRKRNIPLLLAVAQIGDLPLPVYAANNYDKIARPPEIASGPELVYSGNTFLLRGVVQWGTLIDIQEWLRSPAYAESNCEKVTSVKDAIRAYGETRGPAHYDPAVNYGDDFVARARAWGDPVISSLLISTARGVIELADYVLKSLDSGSSSNFLPTSSKHVAPKPICDFRGFTRDAP